MKCPFCSYRDSRVIDSRAVEDGTSIRRRRECPDCGRRFTTYEKYEETPLVVSKKDGRRELFDAKKLLGGLLKAFEKSGELGMQHVEETDQIAYVRFASVYRQFADVKNFMQELERIMHKGQQDK